jgi:hypothetical protein
MLINFLGFSFGQKFSGTEIWRFENDASSDGYALFLRFTPLTLISFAIGILLLAKRITPTPLPAKIPRLPAIR